VKKWTRRRMANRSQLRFKEEGGARIGRGAMRGTGTQGQKVVVEEGWSTPFARHCHRGLLLNGRGRWWHYRILAVR
jgi:hypothetical protein